MNDTTKAAAGSERSSCPACGTDRVEMTAVVHSGPWERVFMECSGCRQKFVAAWENTHQHSVRPEFQNVEL